jgi:formyl-CoA transferase
MTAQIRPQDLPLAGVRVVDLSDGVAGAYGTRLLAAWGADVVKVEPPGGDRTRRLGPMAGDGPDASILFAHLNTGKRGAVIDAETGSGRADLLALLDPGPPAELTSTACAAHSPPSLSAP